MSNKFIMYAVVILVVWFIWHKMGYKNPLSK